MPNTFEITIDGKKVVVDDTMTILEAARKINVYIPALCYHPDLPPTSNCGICVVEVNGQAQPKRACSAPCTPNMTVVTNNHKIREYRKILLRLLLSDHDVSCPTCGANEKCELQKIANDMSVEMRDTPPLLQKKATDNTGIALRRDPNKCIACGRCITICNDIQQVYALTFANRGFVGTVETAFMKGIEKSPCVNCGQCIIYCPTGALLEKSEVDNVWKAIMNKDKHVIVQEAPSIRVSLADEFGMAIGEITTEKMYAALRKIGFDTVMDTNFTADLTIMEEGTELVSRLKNWNKRPMITSCSPGWVKFVETYYPDLVDCLSTAKSPMSMFGVLSKTYFAKTANIDPANIVSVAIMPCTAKKFEANRPEMRDSGFQDTDYVLTTREFIRMIKEVGIDFKSIEPTEPDEGMSFYTGAGTIFGTTGGVMEAALRTAYAVIAGKELENVDIVAVRGLEGIKEATINVPNFGDLRIAVAHSLGKARKLMDKIRKQLNETGTCDYHFIEIMACKGGCVGGGGQPLGNGVSKRAARAEGLYMDDKKAKFRRSHENPEIKKVYNDFLKEPNSDIAHKLLHTVFFKRSQAEGNTIEQITHKEHHH